MCIKTFNISKKSLGIAILFTLSLLPIATACISAPVTGLDKKVHDVMHQPGLRGIGYNQELPIALEIMSLPKSTSVDELTVIVDKKIDKARDLKLNPIEEIRFVLQPEANVSNSALIERAKLLNYTMAARHATNPKFIHGCWSEEWKSPFQQFASKI